MPNVTETIKDVKLKKILHELYPHESISDFSNSTFQGAEQTEATSAPLGMRAEGTYCGS